VTLIPFGFMSQAPLNTACAGIRSAGTIGDAGKEDTTLLTDTQLFNVLPIPITLSAVVKHPARWAAPRDGAEEPRPSLPEKPRLVRAASEGRG